MPRKPKPLPDDPEQSKRFIDLAHELGADESPEAFEKAFDRIVSPKAPREVRPKKIVRPKVVPQKAGSQDDS
jgi:hypothetical protein